MSWLSRLILARVARMHQEPPVRNPDPELVDHAIKTSRALSKSDRALEARRRLNLELEYAEDVIRRARVDRASG